MISDDRKNTIREEEIFRHEIKMQLDAERHPRTRRGKLLHFFNTPFGLWFLSSIVIGLLTYSFTRWQANNEIRNQRQTRIGSLDLEIQSRLKSAQDQLAGANEYFAARSSVATLNSASRIFPEYKERTFLSLLHELSSLVPSGERKPIIEAASAYNRLYKYGQEVLLKDPRNKNVKPVIAKIEQEYINKYFVIRNWCQYPFQ